MNTARTDTRPGAHPIKPTECPFPARPLRPGDGRMDPASRQGYRLVPNTDAPAEPGASALRAPRAPPEAVVNSPGALDGQIKPTVQTSPLVVTRVSRERCQLFETSLEVRDGSGLRLVRPARESVAESAADCRHVCAVWGSGWVAQGFLGPFTLGAEGAALGASDMVEDASCPHTHPSDTRDTSR